MRDLATLPKAHLHLHLDGSLRRSTYLELAAAAGLPAPLPERYGSFADFIDTMGAIGRVLTTPGGLRRVTREVVEDAALAGAVWVEPSVWPDPAALEVVLAAGSDAGAELGVGFGVIVAPNREQGPVEATRAARLAASRAGSGVVGFGMSGDEAAAPLAEFVEAFGIARDAGLAVVPHAGELAGPESVRAALLADRIMHGVRAVEDPALLAKLAETLTPLDVCPTSNATLGVVPTLREHPLPALLAVGVRCSVNADDPLLFGTDLLEEYRRCRDVLGLSDEALAGVARTSIEASGAPDELKRNSLTRLAAWLG